MFALPADLTRGGLSVRPAEPADRPFLRALFATARLDAPFLAQWPAPERDAFLDQQFHYQDTFFRDVYREADFLVIAQDTDPVGRLILERGAVDWNVIDIALMPASRGRGWGTALLNAVHAAATAAGAQGVSLNVERGNPAHGLYARLGFVEFESDNDTHIAMTWSVSCTPPRR